MNILSIVFLIVLIISIALFCSVQKLRTIPLVIGISILILIAFLAGYLQGYLFEAPYYRTDSKLISSIIYIQTYHNRNKQLPDQNAFKAWQELFHPAKSFTYYNSKPSNTQHLSMWGKDGKDYIIGTFNGDGMQFYSSKNSLFYYE